MAVAPPTFMHSWFRRETFRRAHDGFTLLEILVVIALISLLTTAVAVGALTMLEKAKIEQAKNDTASLASVAEAFQVTGGSEDCPTVAELRRDGLLSRRTKT